MDRSSETISAGRTALASAHWAEAKRQFEIALKDSDTPEAHDGLGLALWWLNEIPASHEQRTLAYLGYKSSGNLPKAARLAAWLAREQVFLRANVSAMNGWFGRAFRLLDEMCMCAEAGWVKIYHASMAASPEGATRRIPSRSDPERRAGLDSAWAGISTSGSSKRASPPHR